MQVYDYIIIGGGIVGLTLADALLKRAKGARVLILEKEKELGVHASGRNSGVLHAGLYYKPETLKAKLCVEGARTMRAYCEERRIPFKNLGKVIVPPLEEDLSDGLETIIHNGTTNGVPVEMVDQKTLRELEPAISERVTKGVYSPSTSVVDPKAVLKKLQEELLDSGVKILCDSKVLRISPKNKMVATYADCFSYGHLINAAGAYADVIAHKMGCGLDYQMLPFKGLYYKLAKESGIEIRGNVYPVPDLRVPFLGVHFTRSVHGDVYVGPTAIPALGREHYHGVSGISLEDGFMITSSLASQYLKNNNGFRRLVRQELPKLSKQGFFKCAQRLLPALKQEHLLPSAKVGIRAQLYHKKKAKLEMDFLVEKGEESTHVLNAVSPAFTCSFSFARHMTETYIPA